MARIQSFRNLVASRKARAAARGRFAGTGRFPREPTLMRFCGVLFLLLSSLLLAAQPAMGARISELVDTPFSGRVWRFFLFQDPSLRYALAGSALLGAACGIMGVFLVVRRMALLGDALSHAVLPGVALGFLWNMAREPAAIFLGATLAGLLGAGTTQMIRQTTRQKEDAALGFVLASFFGVGICLFTMIQNLPGGGKSGLDKFMFGQAAALGPGDVALLAGVTILAVAAIGVFYKEFAVTSFDPGFARSAGLPVGVFHYGLVLLLAFAIVASLQAVGVVLVSAMLVIPAAAAYLLADRLGPMLLLAAAFGMGAGGAGAFLSFVGRNLPTGPFMVLSAAAVFAAALLFGPRHGVVSRWWRHGLRAARIRRENTLKAVYHVLEGRDFRGDRAGLREVAERRRETLADARRQVAELRRHGLAILEGEETALTPLGWRRACEIVRNHRLWELYLTHAAHIPADHVHDEAEKIEHILGEETVRRLERRLNFAREDPHGRMIPGLADMSRFGPVVPSAPPETGPGGGSAPSA